MVRTATLECNLCGLPTSHPITGDGDRGFCCSACVEVDRLLREEPVEESDLLSCDLSVATISLAGMWCSSCSWLIDETLTRAKGVGRADVSFLRREARVEYDPDLVSESQLKKRVKRLGYKAWLPGESEKDEEESVYYRMLIGFILTMSIMMISLSIYANRWLGWWDYPGGYNIKEFFEKSLLLGSLPVVLILGLPILRAGVVSLLRGRPNTHTLIAIGAFTAFGLSTSNLISGSDRLYFDTAAVLLLLVTFGHWLELRARKRGTEAIDRLWEQIPDDATVIGREGETVVRADEVQVGARVLVRPGERFPVDGIVADGSGDVDMSILTGEPLPVHATVGSDVFAGTISIDGAFQLVTAAVGVDTTTGRIGRLLHDALWQRSPLIKLADRLAALMVPFAVLIALATFSYWSVTVDIEVGLLNGLSVLLIACPCALGIATPLTTWLAVGAAAKSGVIAKSASSIERLAGVDAVIFDKTGTLTQRPLKALSVKAFNESEAVVLNRVAAVESMSQHPVSGAIIELTTEQGIEPAGCENFVVHPGLGVSGLVDGVNVLAGSLALMESAGTVLPEALIALAERMESSGSSVIYVGWEGSVVGVLEVAERMRSDVQPTFETLRGEGVEVSILTGDSETAGERWGENLSVPVRAAMSPSQKAHFVESHHLSAAMIGDGINDAPSLAVASVGISVGDATDVARSAADVVVFVDDLRAIPWLIDLSRRTMQKVKQNLGWAFGYNIVGIALASMGLLPPVVAAALMVLSSVLVTANASGLRKFESLTERVGRLTEGGEI